MGSAWDPVWDPRGIQCETQCGIRVGSSVGPSECRVPGKYTDGVSTEQALGHDTLMNHEQLVTKGVFSHPSLEFRGGSPSLSPAFGFATNVDS